MAKKLTIAVIGCGEFAQNFVPLFKAHPYVKKVYVCDLLPERAQKYSEKFHVEIIDRYETVLKNPEINAVAIFTQRHTHGPLVAQALRHGKHVYSAVPMASEIEHCHEIVELVKETGLTYMMGETCWFYPCAMFCREMYNKGKFGKFVYAEAQYHHDIGHFPENFRSDLTSAGVPPFYYPTHSTAMVLSAVGSYVKKVSAFGYADSEPDHFYEKGVNMWDNVFSDEFSLMQLANGGVARINECRRIGYKAPSSYISAFYGTEAAYQFNNAQHLMTYKRPAPENIALEDVSDQVNPQTMTEHRGDENFKQSVANHVYQWNDFSPVQFGEQQKLPESFHGLPNGHMASHQFLINDFCNAAYADATPIRNNAWEAARYTIPGLTAHVSVLRGGEVMDVFDCGDPILRG